MSVALIEAEVENKKEMNIMEKEMPSEDIKYIEIENRKYEVVSNYVGKTSLLDIVKSAIRRDIESGKY